MKRFVFFILLLVPLRAFASWEARTIAVSDGDTFRVLSNSIVEVKIRLYGIDAPEKRQDYGMQSKKSLSDLVFGKTVQVETMDTDRYGRTVALVYADGQCVNERQIALGMAWVYEQYCTPEYLALWKPVEALARSDRTGLWAQANPQAPWDYRRSRAEQNERYAERDAKPASKLTALGIIFAAAGLILTLIRSSQRKRYIKRKKNNPDDYRP